MNVSTRTRVIGATAILASLMALSACGTETVTEPDPGTQPATQSRIYPPMQVPVWTPPESDRVVMSADAAERRAAALKARQERADTARWARGTDQENKLKHAGHPGQP